MERLINIFYPSFNSEDPLIFTQLDFWLFFLAVMVVFSFIHKHFLARSIFVTIVSLFFYFKTSGLYVLLLGLSLVVNFALGQMIHTREKKLSKKWEVESIFRLQCMFEQQSKTFENVIVMVMVAVLVVVVVEFVLSLLL